MNKNLEEVNYLINLSNTMYDCANDIGYINTNDSIYIEYCELIDKFCDKYKINKSCYAPYEILNLYWSKNPGRIYSTEIKAIKETLIFLKNSLFPYDYENIFISHREKDKEQVADFVELLHAIGIPRETKDNPQKLIFCSSHPEGYIQNGEPNLKVIRNMLNTDKHVFYILWYSDSYFESQACLNEAGAIWAMNKKYQEILMPKFECKKINGLLDKQPVWFRANDKFRLNTFKEQLEHMFKLSSSVENAWEVARDNFIEKISRY